MQHTHVVCTHASHPYLTPIVPHPPPPTTTQGVLWEQQQHAAPQPTQLLHPEFITYASSLVPNAQPTTGLLGVLLALHRCHNVTLFGFTLGNAPQGDPGMCRGVWVCICGCFIHVHVLKGAWWGLV